MYLDSSGDMTTMEVSNSVEAWYAKKANARNNAKLLYDVSEEFGVEIPTLTDLYSYDHSTIAACTTETLYNDLFTQRDGSITVLNNCVDTTVCKNGVIYKMHPSEGMWLFRGPLKTNSGMMHYGDSFGDQRLQTSFPVASNIVNEAYPWKGHNLRGSSVCNRGVGFVYSRDSSVVSRINMHGELCTDTPHTNKYTCVDESFLSSLKQSMWKRDNGITELIPIAVVHQQDV
jgi:hypothetical protein